MTGGTLVAGSSGWRARRLCTDSREIRPGDLFFALAGPNFDGHQFVGKAFKLHAMGAVIEESWTSRVLEDRKAKGMISSGRPAVISVSNPLTSFQELAAYHRRRFDIPLVAVTGSNGKTTTKEMITATLKARWRVLSTKGNLNNSIGVPKTLLRLHRGHDVAVVEMGVDHEGQTTRLCELANPTVGVITNIGPDHLEFFGDLDGSARAKAELLHCLPRNGTAILNADDAYFSALKKQARCRVISFGFSRHADVRGSRLLAGAAGTSFHVSMDSSSRSRKVRVHAYGSHNMANALAALAVGQACGMPFNAMSAGLSTFRPAAMRSEVRHYRGITIVHDCYNANPASMKAAIDLLVDLGKGRRTIAVLGDMLELGSEAVRFHREVGAYAAKQGVACLVACGELGKEIAHGARASGLSALTVQEFPSAEAAARGVTSTLKRGDVMLLKGSRGMRMESILDQVTGVPLNREGSH